MKKSSHALKRQPTKDPPVSKSGSHYRHENHRADDILMPLSHNTDDAINERVKEALDRARRQMEKS
jgi:hypothetical protein